MRKQRAVQIKRFVQAMVLAGLISPKAPPARCRRWYKGWWAGLTSKERSRASGLMDKRIARWRTVQ